MNMGDQNWLDEGVIHKFGEGEWIHVNDSCFVSVVKHKADKEYIGVIKD